MRHRVSRHWAIGVVSLLAAVGVAIAAQSALASIATTEADAADFIKNIVDDGGPAYISLFDTKVDRALTAFKKLPASSRGPVTTQLYAWAKAYVSTPAFKAWYAKAREEAKPMLPEVSGTVDQELKEKVDKENADREESIKNMEKMGLKDAVAAMRAQWAESKDQVIAAWRQEIVERRQKDKEGYEQGMKDWQVRLPADVQVIIARSLRGFVDNTADVDFAAKRHRERSEAGGEDWVFDNKAYLEKPWQWKFAYEFGPEAIAAARTAAAAWLRELPAR